MCGDDGGSGDGGGTGDGGEEAVRSTTPPAALVELDAEASARGRDETVDGEGGVFLGEGGPKGGGVEGMIP